MKSITYSVVISWCWALVGTDRRNLILHDATQSSSVRLRARDLMAFVEAVDRRRLERRFDALAAFFAPDLIVTAPDGPKVEGAEPAIQSYRDFMDRAEVQSFER